jgi:hypothetical protein
MTTTEKLTENLYGKVVQVSLNDGTVFSDSKENERQ